MFKWKPLRQRQRGISLLEVGLALAVSAMGVTWVIQQQYQKSQDIKVELAASKVKNIAVAGDAYILANTDNLANILKDQAIVVIPAGRWTKDFEPLSNVEMPSIQKSKFLPDSFLDVNVWSQHHALMVKKTSDTTMEAILFTYGGEPIQDGNLGRVAVKTGVSGGFIATNTLPGILPTTIQGVAGGWSSDVKQWTVLNNELFALKPGHIAYTMGKYDFAINNPMEVPEALPEAPVTESSPPTNGLGSSMSDPNALRDLLKQQQELKDTLNKLKESNKVDQCITFGFCN